MSRRIEARKIIWAVDVLADPLAQTRMLKVLDLWARGLRVSIHPVYVQGAAAYRPREEGVGGELLARFSPFIPRDGSPALAGLRVLRINDATLRGRAAALLKHAASERASLIALTTRARAGVSRWAFGSLTETMLLSSRVPLLTLNPDARPFTRLKRMLFPTDLSEASDRALDIVVEEARLRELALSIVYCSQFDQAHSGAAYGPAAGYAQARAQYLRRTRERLNEMVLAAMSRGLDAEGILLDGKYDVAEAILHAAAEGKAELIAMASHCGPLDAALGGSMTRRIVRAAACPVLAFHQD